jgi:hypothetical protein
MSAQWFIYALTDPKTEAVRYIGYTANPKKRLYQHIYHCNGKDSHKNSWIKKLLSEGNSPNLVILERGDGPWQEREKYWIQHYRNLGVRLTNSTNGGDGACGLLVSEETRRKIGNQSRESKRYVNWINAAISSNIGRKQSKEAIEKRVAKVIGRKMSQETKDKIRAKALGRAVSEETKAKMSASHVGKVKSEETRKKLSRSLMGHPVSQELRQHFSITRKGIPWSDERRRKHEAKKAVQA